MVQQVRPMVLIGLGSNQGASVEIVHRALLDLQKFAQPGTFAQSRLWQTSPVDCPPDSGLFLNAVACFEIVADVSPEALLVKLKALERRYGRGEKLVRNAPRELDLDLLVFGNEQRNTADFVLPHPRAADRLFVLAPAAEIVPELVWPGLSKTVRELLNALESDEEVKPMLCQSRTD